MVKSDSNTLHPSSNTKQHWSSSVWRRSLKFLFPFQVPGQCVGHLQHLCLETTLRPQRIFSYVNFVIKCVLNGHQLYLLFTMLSEATDASRSRNLIALPDLTLLMRNPQELPHLLGHPYGSSGPQHTVLSATPWKKKKQNKNERRKTSTFSAFLAVCFYISLILCTFGDQKLGFLVGSCCFPGTALSLGGYLSSQAFPFHHPAQDNPDALLWGLSFHG